MTMVMNRETDRVKLADVIAGKCIAINGILKKTIITQENNRFLELHKGLIEFIEKKMANVSDCIQYIKIDVENTTCKHIVLDITATGFRQNHGEFTLYFSACVLPTFSLGLDMEVVDKKLQPKKIDDEMTEFVDEIFESLERELSSMHSERYFEEMCGYHPGATKRSK